jgi:ankyrin repeat protein
MAALKARPAMETTIRTWAARLFLLACLIGIVVMWRWNSQDDSANRLIDAAQRGDVRAIEIALKRGTPIESRDSCGLTPLLIAIRADHPETAQYLLTQGASILADAGSYGTPLMQAAKNGQVEVVRELLARGADPNQCDQENACTALWLAAITNRPEQAQIVRLLIDAGAQVNTRSQQGDTALMASVASGNVRAAQTLIQAGADVSIRNLSGETALYLAERERNSPMVALLKRHTPVGAKFAAADRHRDIDLR